MQVVESNDLVSPASPADGENLASVVFVGSGKHRPFAFPRPTDEAVKNSMIMIVDDEPAVTGALKKHLQLSGFQRFHLVSDAQVAVQEIRRVNPDIVLLDVRMPVSGLKILEMMGADELLRHIPVVTLTGDTDATTKLKALNLGASDFLTKPVDISELVARVRNTLSGKAFRDQLTKYSSKLESDVLRDGLTQVANRRAFEYELQRRMIEWKRQRTPLGLILVDIDFFKSFNDRYGHPVGDIVLREVASQIQSDVREMDLVARYGGEEFAVILPATRPEESRLAGERIRMSIESKVMKSAEDELRVTVSVGVANAMNGDDVELLIRRVDTALYASKNFGRNGTTYNNGAKCVPVSSMTQGSQAAAQSIRPTAAFDTSVLTNVAQARILIIDDEPSTCFMVRKLLREAGYEQVLIENDSTKAMALIAAERPDLVLLDIRMPEVDGLQVLKLVRGSEDTKHVPIVILTSTTETATKINALNSGANDFLPKPVNASELVARVRNTLLAKAHVDYLADYSNQLEHEVRLRTSELMASRREAIQCLARAAEIRDDQTGQHVFRVGRYASIIANELGFTQEQIMWMEHAAQLHDVGKIGIPDGILKKPAGLTEDEFEIIKSHCAVGSNIIRDESDPEVEVDLLKKHAKLGARIFDDCNSPIMRMAALVAETHHEKWDGSGYPRGLAGKEIPLEGRITAVADVFDALSSRRPYKECIPVDNCFEIIGQGRGTHFDPEIVDAFQRCRSQVLEVFNCYGDETPAGPPAEGSAAEEASTE